MARHLELLLGVVVRRRNAFAAVCLWCTLLCLCSFPPALAQYRFDVWTADDGLPQNLIRFVHQTRDGYLWLSTYDGLVRFDGLRFTVFNKSNSPGINSNRFETLYEDREGALWAGTENGGLTRYFQGHFTTWTTQHGLASNYIRGIAGDQHGNLWVVSGNQIMRWAEGRFQPIQPAAPEMFFTGAGNVVGRGGRGGLWGVNDTTLYYYIDGRMTVLSRKDGLPSLQITAVVEDRHGALWAATLDAGVTKIEGGKVVRVYRAAGGLPGDWAWLVVGPTLKALSRDRHGALWLTDLDTGEDRLLTEHPPAALARASVHRLFEDREGNLWIGTEGGGLYRARPQAITVYSKEDGLAGRNVYPIVEDHDGGIWVGTDDLTRIKDGKFTVYTARNSSLGLVYGGLYVDRGRRLWAGADVGVQVLDRGRFKVISELRELTAITAMNEDGEGVVTAMHEDRGGVMWLGTVSGKLIRHQDGASVVYTSKDGLAGDDIKVIIEDAAGDLWIGSYGGLTRFKDGRFTRWTERDGLPGNNVRSLYADADGALWIGTYDSGLGRFKDGRFTRYTTRDGLYNNGVFQILEDARGNLWMSSNRGIYRVSKGELNEFAEGRRSAITSVAYGKSNGMLNAECNGGRSPAGIRARDGKLWFPTQDGVAVIDPEAITTNQRPPPVMIEAVFVDRAPVAFDRPVRITPGRDNFEIGYTALSFIGAEHIKFKYKLEGLDREWVDAGTRRTAYYSYLPPGGYTFRVIAANSDGVWNTEGQSLSVVVLPPFYRTWWFVSLAALGLAAVVAVSHRRRVAHLRREHERQQAFSRQLIASQEQERKRIAAELHDSLGQDLLVIKNRAILSAMTQPAGQTRSQFDDISTSVSHTLEEVRAIAWNLRPSHLDQLGLKTALVAMIEKVGASCETQFTCDIADLDGLLAPADEITVYRIVQESINNIVKHARATEARIAVERRGRRLQITIRDNGRGFSPNGGIQNGEYRAGSAPPPVNPPSAGPNPQSAIRNPQSNGFGLTGIAERVSMLGGSHAIHSTPGEGTTVSVRLDLPGGNEERTDEQ